MKALAVELSSGAGSLAVFGDGERLGTAQWEQRRRGGQALFREWPDLLDRVGMAMDEIDVYICGRGPGTFSGLRVALAAVRAAAIPTGARIYALSSGEALAADLFAGGGQETVAIIGDARRDRLWCGLFHRRQTTDPTWALIRPDQLPHYAGEAAVWASPQFTRLSSLLPDSLRTHPSWIPRDRLPRAEGLGRAALLRIRNHRPSEPFAPLYLHPPVAQKHREP